MCNFAVGIKVVTSLLRLNDKAEDVNQCIESLFCRIRQLFINKKQ